MKTLLISAFDPQDDDPHIFVTAPSIPKQQTLLS
jgi:hypothetical protein